MVHRKAWGSRTVSSIHYNHGCFLLVQTEQFAFTDDLYSGSFSMKDTWDWIGGQKRSSVRFIAVYAQFCLFMYKWYRWETYSHKQWKVDLKRPSCNSHTNNKHCRKKLHMFYFIKVVFEECHYWLQDNDVSAYISWYH